MADEDSEAEVKPKKPLLKILLLSLIVVLLLGGAVGGTLFFTGFFAKKAAVSAEAALAGAEEDAHGGNEGGGAAGHGAGHGGGHDAGHGAAAAPGKASSTPQRVTKKSPDFVRFVYTYKQLEKELLSNLTGSRKVMQVQIALMTSYDDRVFKNVERHEFAIRGAVLDVMRQVTEADLVRPEFRKELAEKFRDEINKVLEKYEDFGGIDAVHFTSFVVQ